LISYDFFNYVANQTVLLKIKDVASRAHLQKFLNIQILAAEGLKLSACLITDDLVDVYEKQCRSVPVWNSWLPVSNCNQIERVQKTALAIILGENYTSYSSALQKLQMVTLSDRRKALCLSFAKKSYKREKFKKWFCDEEGPGPVKQLVEVKTRTGRYKKSPLPYLTDLLNQDFRK
jgi:hypothetical protein